jgi:SAM-dependent methyltransferase
MALFLQILERFPPGRLVDLGAGHGWFARLAADAGWEATAVDARDERFTEDDRVRWVEQDVREFPLEGFDVVCCLGLWYHLTLEDQLNLARRAGGSPLMIDTHYALASDADHHKNMQSLTPMMSQQGYEGRLYGEQDFQDRNTASFGNLSSFWPTESSLRRELKESGYDIVETFDPPVTLDRRFFLATCISPTRGVELDRLISNYTPPKPT